MKLEDVIAKNKSNSNKSSQLIKEIFVLVKDNIKYKFGDWRLNPDDTLQLGFGMCTTKSRLLFEILKSLGFKVYYFKLRINAREVFGKFTFDEVKKYISNNSVHFYIGVEINNKIVKLDPSIDRDLEEKIVFLGYEYNKNWDISQDYMNFIDKKYVISEERINNIDEYLNRKINITNRIKFFISNIFLQYIREADIEDLKTNFTDRNLFFKWLSKKNFFYYLLFKIFLI